MSSQSTKVTIPCREFDVCHHEVVYKEKGKTAESKSVIAERRLLCGQ